MEGKEERRLLYFDYYEVNRGHSCGSSIHLLAFKNVKTGESLTLSSCFDIEERSRVIRRYSYENRIGVAGHDDFLWNLGDTISPVTETFEEVQSEYNRMIQEGVSLDEINQAMLNLYNVKPKVKRLNLEFYE